MTTEPDNKLTDIAITADDLEPDNDQGGDTVGLTVIIPAGQAEKWASEHKKELEEFVVDVGGAHSEPEKPSAPAARSN
jgi:hypothetical protein